MPLKLNVGLTKKIGQPDYGSLGASCYVEVELEHRLIETDLDGFHERVRKVFNACRQAVAGELAQQQGLAFSHRLANGRRNGSNGHDKHLENGAPPKDQTRRATASQVRALLAIADRNGIDLTALTHDRYQNPVRELSIVEASQLIDELKSNLNAAGGRA